MRSLAALLLCLPCAAQQSIDGLWAWDNEILAVSGARAARSKDGGATWSIETHPELAAANGSELHTPIDFEQPGFALLARGEGTSRFWWTPDRGHTWHGPYRLPMFGLPSLSAATDYLVLGKYEALLFIAASEGRGMCIKTEDGGQAWSFVSWIGDDAAPPSASPSTVRLSRNALVTAVQAQSDSIDVYRSLDRGATWELYSPQLASAGPPSLVLLKDGRLCLTSGRRARFSSDEGYSWGNEVTLSPGQAASARSVQRPDGKVVSVYYIQERLVEATIWNPNQ